MQRKLWLVTDKDLLFLITFACVDMTSGALFFSAHEYLLCCIAGIVMLVVFPFFQLACQYRLLFVAGIAVLMSMVLFFPADKDAFRIIAVLAMLMNLHLLQRANKASVPIVAILIMGMNHIISTYSIPTLIIDFSWQFKALYGMRMLFFTANQDRLSICFCNLDNRKLSNNQNKCKEQRNPFTLTMDQHFIHLAMLAVNSARA